MSPPRQMRAVVLTGHGGLDKLEVRDDWPAPEAGPGEVLIRVGAAGLNNTDINTRTGWYSRTVREGTTAEGGAGGFGEITEEAATWGDRPLRFPRIQGADVCGRIVAVGEGVSEDRIGERVLVESWLRDPADPADRTKAGYFGSERDGGFAAYTTAPAVNAHAIDSPLSDAELATFPCSYSTAEYMLTRVRLAAGETILISGASGGVGSALVQLAKRRGARVIAVVGASKTERVREIGADAVIPRDVADFAGEVKKAVPGGRIEVAADIVGGGGFSSLIDLLTRGGRYVTSGAIAGPLVELDLRTLYLHDLEIHGATVMPRGIFENLVGYIERGEIRPLLAATFPLTAIHKAQETFMSKSYVGKLVVLPGEEG